MNKPVGEDIKKHVQAWRLPSKTTSNFLFDMNLLKTGDVEPIFVTQKNKQKMECFFLRN